MDRPAQESIVPWWYTSGVPRGEPSPKLTITVDPRVHAEALAAAAQEGMSVSAWMTAAARRALLVADGLRAVAEWESEHGRLSEPEMRAARARVTGERPSGERPPGPRQRAA